MSALKQLITSCFVYRLKFIKTELSKSIIVLAAPVLSSIFWNLLMFSADLSGSTVLQLMISRERASTTISRENQRFVLWSLMMI